MEGYIGEIRLFAANFAPRNWAYCQGQIIAISTNSALFSILGTTYGGNGQTTFGLPNFASRTAVGAGQGAGLPYVSLGEVSGYESVSLVSSNLPPHNHTANISVSPLASADPGEETNPTSAFPGNNQGSNIYTNSHNSMMGQVSVPLNCGPSGNSAPHNNIQPSLGMNYIICMYGIYPSRN